MAGQITHMEIAYRLLNRLGISEGKEEYILGSVAPDSVHFDEDYLSKKIHSHLFENCGPWGDTQDYDNWIVNIKAFWNKYVVGEKDNIKRAFYIGICVHCLTDYWNDLLIWRTLQKKMIPPMTNDSFKEAYYPESTRIDRWLYQNTDNAGIIMALLENSGEKDFEDYVKASCMKKMKRHLIDEQYKLPDPIDVSGHQFYKKDMMLEFIREVPDRVFRQIQDFCNGKVFNVVKCKGQEGFVDEASVRKKYSGLTLKLIKRKLTVTTMESCTAGAIVSLLTDTEGSSAVVKGSFVTYANEAKIKQGVDPQIINTFGVYSPETACAMANACIKTYVADLAVAITGSFGNVDPNNEDSIPGEVFFAIADEKETTAYHCEVPVQPSRLKYKLYMADVVADAILKKLG